MGVAHPIWNWSFRHPSVLKVSLGSDYNNTPSGSVTFYVNWTPTDTSLYYYVKEYDRVLLGPSSHASYKGKTEECLVSSVSTTNFVTRYGDGGQYRYLSGDPMTIIGTGTAAGWRLAFASPPDVNDLPLLSNVAHDAEGFDDKYFGQRFSKAVTVKALYLEALKDLTTARGNAAYYLQSLEPGVTWLLSVHAKAGAYSGTGVSFDLEGAGSNLTFTFIPTTSWQEFSTVGTTGTGTDPENDRSSLLFAVPAASACTNLILDCVVVCHAKGTDDAASGIYTFDDYAEEGSIQYEQRNKGMYSDLVNDFRTAYFPGAVDQKWVVRAHFEGASQALWDNLMALWQWQKRGNVLTLKTFLADLPPYITGIMDIKAPGKDSWDFTKRSFDLEFVEA